MPVLVKHFLSIIKGLAPTADVDLISHLSYIMNSVTQNTYLCQNLKRIKLPKGTSSCYIGQLT